MHIENLGWGILRKNQSLILGLLVGTQKMENINR